MKKDVCFLVSLFMLNTISVHAETLVTRAKPATTKPATTKPVTTKPVEEQQPVKVKKLGSGKFVKRPIQKPIEKLIEKPIEKLVVKYAYPIEDILKMENDKEVVSTSISAGDKQKVLNKFNEDDKVKMRAIFYKEMHSFLNAQDAKCDSNFISNLIAELERYKVAKTENEMKDAFKFLRVTNAIDDIMFDILDGLSKDYFALLQLNVAAKVIENPLKNYVKISKDYDLEVFFSEFKTFPDETNKCAYREFSLLQAGVGEKKDSLKTKNKILRDLSVQAYKDGVIDLLSFNMIKFLATSSTLNTRNVWLSDYVNTIISAKNRMATNKNKYKVINVEDENKYTSEKKSRFSKLTLRKTLYYKYDANQIILLAQVMKKASQRMGVDPDTKSGVPYVVQEFKDLNKAGEEANYVEKIELDTQSQFNLARRLLRRDLVKLQMMESFVKEKITYDDLVTAAVETGYISLDDLDYVVSYDDLWNPEISKNDKMMNIGFRIAGYSTFFLPPPWNVTGALAISIIEGIVDSKKVNGADNDNPNTFIE